MKAFTLAHLSDPHLGPMPQARLRQLANKRAIGYYNWTRKRAGVHRRDVLAQLVTDMQAQQPDHIAITGDLVNIALPLEFTQAREWLESVGKPQDVSVVPGNHDAYVRGLHENFPDAWADFMRGDDPTSASYASFPYVRRRGPIALIGVSSAVPTAPFLATGLLGSVQREALEGILKQLALENLFRVLLIHHPLMTARGRWTARLRDSDQLIALLKRHGVDLILHGHDHRHATTWFEGPHGRIPAVGITSASSIAHGHYEPAAYNIFSIEREHNGWRCNRTVRGLSGDTTFGEIASERLI